MRSEKVEMSDSDLEYMPFPMAERVPKWPAGGNVSAVGVSKVGVSCQRDPEESADMECDSFLLDEFVDLTNGERISIRWDRAFGISHDADEPLTEELLRENLEIALLPDEGEIEDENEARSWFEYSLILKEYGLAVSADELRSSPYLIEFDPDLESNLSGESRK